MYTDPTDEDRNDPAINKNHDDASQGTGKKSSNLDSSKSQNDDALLDQEMLPAETENMAALLSNNMMPKQYRRGDYVDGIVVAQDRDGLLVDIGTKSEAVLPFKELMTSGYGSMEQTKLNDRIHVVITQPETSDGHAFVSVRRARQENIWSEVQTLKDNGEIIDAEVKDSNRGGLLVEFNTVRGFVPISQLAVFKRDDKAESTETQEKLRHLIGKRLKLKIIEVNRSRNRLILSERDAMKELRDANRDSLMNSLAIGSIIDGTVSNLTNFGAFVDIGGADGLVHISEMSYSHINNPNEVLHIHQPVKVMVKGIDKDSKRIALTMKLPDSDPWQTVQDRYPADLVVKGNVMKIVPFGAFVRLEDGVDGLIHTSEIHPPTNDPKAVLKEGDSVEVKILKVDIDNRRLRLSMRALFAADAAVPATETETETMSETPLLADVASESLVPPEQASDVEVAHPPSNGILHANQPKEKLVHVSHSSLAEELIIPDNADYSSNEASL